MHFFNNKTTVDHVSWPLTRILSRLVSGVCLNLERFDFGLHGQVKRYVCFNVVNLSKSDKLKRKAPKGGSIERSQLKQKR